MDETRVTTALTLRLLDSLPTFMGIIDVSLDWQFMIDVVSTAGAKHERFQILSGSVL